ncbi:hypothetical protein SLEP1_g47157 [Rubroshorea leprosula]|uniref:Uncharacterized protein n=1 Tax=Rubroshorea leprosula TaxID=152421 RepID=A0AAV5LPL3_9ROSI|nr:hypothetical protein SLEP1_g47157 [Rubroshorea leprosula]
MEAGLEVKGLLRWKELNKFWFTTNKANELYFVLL